MTLRGGPSARTASAAVFLGALAAGCYTPGYNSYATARTVPKGGFSAAVHAQVTGHSGEVDGEREPHVMIFPPGFSARYGLAERLDAGVRGGIGTGLEFALGGDLKWLVLPGEALDLAVDPGLDYTYLTWIGPQLVVGEPAASRNTEVWQLRAPIVTGLNISKSFVVVLTTGLVYGWSSEGIAPGPQDRGRLIEGAAPLVGLGFDLRTVPKLSFHPETTFVFSTAENERRFIYTVGFAVRFGRLPRMFRSPPPRPPERPGETPERWESPE